jgi:hypothetical protein
MSYDPRNLIDRFLRLNKLNMPVNNLPSVAYPFGINPPTLFRKDKSKLTSGSVTDDLQDSPKQFTYGNRIIRRSACSPRGISQENKKASG